MSSGLVISRLGVQATATDDLVHGLICLRISLPRENDSNHSMRWNLFSGTHPKLISEPTIHALPLPLPISSGPRTSRPRALAIASTLLNLSSPPDASRIQVGPHLHVTPNGGVSVVLDPLKGKRRSTHVHGTPGRSDWVVILEFEAPVEQGGDRHFRKVLLSLPKCLHSIIRFQISPPASGPSREGEVSILTEPKMLALPLSTFSSPPLPFPREERGYGDGWQDGEDGISEMSDIEDDESWLEGRFQATNQLRLEWSFVGTSSTTMLNITPSWERQEIRFNYETTLAPASALVPIELIIPTGWGWSHLDIQGSSLRSFRSTDIIAWHTAIHRSGAEEGEEEDEPFSTIRNNIIPPTLRPNNTNTSLSASRSSSLMKQSLPTGDVDEFSFENQEDSHTTIIPPSPVEERKVIVPEKPTAARLFDLVFDDDSEDRSLMIEGVLVPLFPTLVSGSVPVQIPFVRAAECQVTCPNSNFDGSEVDTSGISIGEFTWVDMYGSPIPSADIAIRGDVRVRLMRDSWTVRMSILLPYTTGEVAFNLEKGVRIRKAVVDGVAIRYCLTESGEGSEVRLRSEVAGMADVEVELGDGVITLPHFESAEGTMTIELRGSGWDSLLSTAIPGLTPHPTLSHTYTTPLPSPPIYLNLNPSSKRKVRTLFSFSTFFNLLLLWLVVSLGQQVQRLRSEMVFVVEEARDLRMYHTPSPAPPLPSVQPPSEILPDGIDLKELLERLRLEQTTTSPSSLVTNHSLGRVVSNQWEWVNHPALRTVTNGVAKIWDVVLWLLHG